MTIKALRILPPLAIARLGSAPEPVDNFCVDDPDPSQPLGFRRITPLDTLVVDPVSGKVERKPAPESIQFREEQSGPAGKSIAIRPVAPFLEVHAVTEGGKLEPLTLDLLRAHGHERASTTWISWQVRVANLKIVRRTDEEDDAITADTSFSDHTRHQLVGKCKNFVSGKTVNFGHVQFIDPASPGFPEIRLRFTPAAGLIYGPTHSQRNPDPFIDGKRSIYKRSGKWVGLHGIKARNPTMPPSLFAITPGQAPSWLHNNVADSRGYFDDTCDGFVEVELAIPGGRKLRAMARICSGPPAIVPDSFFVRSLADDLDQVIFGPKVADIEPPEVTRRRAEDIVRRAYETVRFMNVAVMNGNNFKGRNALLLDSMPQEEAAITQRAIRPVMSAGSVDTLAILALHQQVYAALRSGAAPWFLRVLRRPEEVADFTDRGRRKMPPLMCGADNNYLALTHRQIDTIAKVADLTLFQGSDVQTRTPKPRNRTAQRAYDAAVRLRAELHFEAAGNPVSSRPVSAIANCCPGLEMDFRAVWRRIFEGIVLREYDNLVVEADDRLKHLVGRRLLRVAGVLTMGPILGPAPSDPKGEFVMTTESNPHGLAPLEWSNALAQVLKTHAGRRVWCEFSEEDPDEDNILAQPQQPYTGRPPENLRKRLKVRNFFEPDTAFISKALAEPGELTQGLCSPWQNDYRECSCYYWASARPDYINVEPAANGLSTGDNWLQKERTGEYVPDDYVDSRLVLYDDLFGDWEKWLRFQIGGRDSDSSGNAK